MHGLMLYRRFGRARSLRSDQAERTLGRCVATELHLGLGRYELGPYVATELRPSRTNARSLRSDQAWLELLSDVSCFLRKAFRKEESISKKAEPLHTYIAPHNQEKVAIPECKVVTAISAFKRGLLPDGDLYKELTKYQCKTMEDVLSQTWTHVKWKENVESCWGKILRYKISPDPGQDTGLQAHPEGNHGSLPSLHPCLRVKWKFSI
ncbi:hypothetical protein F2Q70_00030019 [Brassica cretica]|uniref:Uncharacterized protein n=1 Tax=Brassica cretica TaxID=69181 RepID=A0A8S9H9G9_BRACR|nr:hypothetical protein F2Q70_00030019 [Brassica cretica]KAF2552902.1 hypothetical protein F2Q68_00034495 [Brassica cretica]